jgi:hypothetical protein
MADTSWGTPLAIGSVTNIASTTLDSLANSTSGTTGVSAFVTHDNSTDKKLYANVRITLGSLTPAAGGSITLCVFSAQDTTAPTNTAGYGGGDRYPYPLDATTSAKECIIPMVRLYPESMRLCLVNNAGVALAASGNGLRVRPYGESVV